MQHLSQMTPAEILDLARQGDPEAQYVHSLYCEAGIQASPDLPEAFRFCLQAANAGYYPAARRAASMLERGLGVSQDSTQAFYWYTRAAELGDADSATRLGRMYANGEGVEKSEAKALEWYEEGKKRGSPWALFALSSVYRFGELGQIKDGSKADVLGDQAVELIKERAARETTGSRS